MDCRVTILTPSAELSTVITLASGAPESSSRPAMKSGSLNNAKTADAGESYCWVTVNGLGTDCSPEGWSGGMGDGGPPAGMSPRQERPTGRRPSRRSSPAAPPDASTGGGTTRVAPDADTSGKRYGRHDRITGDPAPGRPPNDHCICVPRSSYVSRHPLDSLSTEEFTRTTAALRASGDLIPSRRFASIALDEPAKAAVLAWREGDPIVRRSPYVLWD